MLVGVISDTHGVLPDWVMSAFEGVDCVVHAGDVCGGMVLEALETIAPVVAVRGNTDSRDGGLPDHRRVEIGGVDVLVTHEPGAVPRLLRNAPADVVITGHTHRARIERAGGHLALNPGSASWPRGEGCSVALLRVDAGAPSAVIVQAPL